MNYFDRYLEIELKLTLDPLVLRRPPARRGPGGAPPQPLPGRQNPAAEQMPMIEPAVVGTMPATAGRAP